jgi:hypothetical protein
MDSRSRSGSDRRPISLFKRRRADFESETPRVHVRFLPCFSLLMPGKDPRGDLTQLWEAIVGMIVGAVAKYDFAHLGIIVAT